MISRWLKAIPAGGVAFALVLTLLHTAPSRADDTWTYAVQLSATVQSSPTRIILRWPVDPYGASSYTVYRKSKDSGSWGAGTALPGSATSFEDNNVSNGTGYEYQVFKQGKAGYRGYGYIYSGAGIPMVENRGKIILVVAADPGALSSELARLEEDLAGDGWQVLRHDVSSMSSPGSVRNLIVGDYWAAPTQVKAVFLFGPVPILMSGNLEYDSHGARPMPADAFYGDMDGNWRDDQAPSSRPSYIPSDIELMVGRVDFQSMPSMGASETELLRRYLNKDHAWRHKQFTVPRRALMGNRVGDANGMAYAASGYRNFEPMVGPGNIVEANVSDGGANSERWISKVSGSSYLWSYGCGGGQATVVSHLGIHGTYKEVWSTDLVAQDAKAVFSMFFGSHFGEWTTTDNVIRAILAAPSVTLATCLVGLPHYYLHHMALGEPIGYGIRLTMNNSRLYQNHSNLLTRSVLVNLLGDPTLRLERVAPPRNLNGSAANGTASLSWNASPDQVAGYHVYRSSSQLGPFTRVSDSPVQGTTFLDSSGPAGLRYYAVRALALQTTPSGSYYDLSQAAFTSVNVGDTPPPPPPPPPPSTNSVVSVVTLSPSGPQITWNSEQGSAYHVEGMVLIYNNDWVNLSGRVVATGNQTSFTDGNWIWYWTRFYRVVRE